MLKKIGLLVVLCLANAQAQHLVVILGSSSAAGVGATTYDSSYAGRYAKYLAGLPGGWRQVNLAVSTYTTYHLMPTGYVPPAGRVLPDTSHNITKALSLKPDIILYALGSNDIQKGFAASEYEKNYDSIRTLVVKAGVPIWISTTLPRNIDSTGRRKLLEFRSRVLNRYAPQALDFYDTLGLPDGSYNSVYNSGDGIHTNNRGHYLLFNRLVAAKITAIPVKLRADSELGLVLPDLGFQSGFIWEARNGSMASRRPGSYLLYDMQGRTHFESH